MFMIPKSIIEFFMKYTFVFYLFGVLNINVLSYIKVIVVKLLFLLFHTVFRINFLLEDAKEDHKWKSIFDTES